jgi:hypothetical protein
MHLQSGNTYRMRIGRLAHRGVHASGRSIRSHVAWIRSATSILRQPQQADLPAPRGGRYEAFDRDTDDGLGLAPRMMEHLHGSTADRRELFLRATNGSRGISRQRLHGNVVTGRSIATSSNITAPPQGDRAADLLKSDDPWFRPSNTVLGPDGALYVADFYNRIIGHYEVKLESSREGYERGGSGGSFTKGQGAKKLISAMHRPLICSTFCEMRI